MNKASDQDNPTRDDQSGNMIQGDYAGSSTLQTPEEYEKDKHGNNADSISVSRSADRESEADKYAGSDRTGTAERKSQELDTTNDEQ